MLPCSMPADPVPVLHEQRPIDAELMVRAPRPTRASAKGPRMARPTSPGQKLAAREDDDAEQHKGDDGQHEPVEQWRGKGPC